MQEKNEEEINRIKILNDIYKNENERLKYEYRVLVDQFEEYKKTNKPSLLKKVIRKIRRKLFFKDGI